MFKTIPKFFAVGYSSIIFLLLCAAFCFINLALFELWHGINPAVSIAHSGPLQLHPGSIGLLTIAAISMARLTKASFIPDI